jgi:hypothetical protein
VGLLVAVVTVVVEVVAMVVVVITVVEMGGVVVVLMEVTTAGVGRGVAVRRNIAQVVEEMVGVVVVAVVVVVVAVVVAEVAVVVVMVVAIMVVVVVVMEVGAGVLVGGDVVVAAMYEYPGLEMPSAFKVALVPVSYNICLNFGTSFNKSARRSVRAQCASARHQVSSVLGQSDRLCNIGAVGL